MLNAIPIVMIRNEENYIAQVLGCLRAAFRQVMVGDTGSTDGTMEIVTRIPGCHVIEYEEQDSRVLGWVRKDMSERAIKMGFEWGFLVDGDEIYHPQALKLFLERGMPPGKTLGFSKLLTLEQDGGMLWETTDVYDRTLVFRLDDAWSGDYPYEFPMAFRDKALYHYYDEFPPGFDIHGYHLHRLRRSQHDEWVYMRRKKQKQFAMQEKAFAKTRPVARWPQP